MSLPVEQIEAEAMKLPPEVRADLADWLWNSVTPHEEVKAAWDVEIARRIAEIDAGNVEWVSAEQVLAMIDEKILSAKELAKKSK